MIETLHSCIRRSRNPFEWKENATEDWKRENEENKTRDQKDSIAVSELDKSDCPRNALRLIFACLTGDKRGGIGGISKRQTQAQFALVNNCLISLQFPLLPRRLS